MTRSTELPTTLSFNPKQPTKLHIDMNSCFATVEQQANAYLRGKPVAVAAYTTPSGCIVAPSVEAKALGIKVGMRVKDATLLCPSIVILPPDPPKYRHAHLALRRIVEGYTDRAVPKSIDEFVLDLEGCPAQRKGLVVVAHEIKARVRQDLGEWVRVSIGIAPNRFLAKTAASLHKPDGLDVIDARTVQAVYAGLTLTDLCGIDRRNAARLNLAGIHTVPEFATAPLVQLRAAFQSIVGYYWYVRLRGWEIDDVAFGRRSYGNSYSLPKPFATIEELSPILCKLVVKMGQRLRRAGYVAHGIHLALAYRDGDFWHRGELVGKQLSTTPNLYREAFRLLRTAPYCKPVRTLAVSCFDVRQTQARQLDLFADIGRQERLQQAVDAINERWGDYVLTPALLVGHEHAVPDRIAFGGVKELEELVTAEEVDDIPA